jgi:hypothetical protein
LFPDLHFHAKEILLDTERILEVHAHLKKQSKIRTITAAARLENLIETAV